MQVGTLIHHCVLLFIGTAEVSVVSMELHLKDTRRDVTTMKKKAPLGVVVMDILIRDHGLIEEGRCPIKGHESHSLQTERAQGEVGGTESRDIDLTVERNGVSEALGKRVIMMSFDASHPIAI